MESIRETKSRIGSITSIQQITGAMELISVSRLRKLESKVTMSRSYIKRLRELLEDISSVKEQIVHPLMKIREPRTIAVLIITSDRGLCGAYNSNIIEAANKFIVEQSSNKLKVKLSLIGRKGNNFFKKRQHEIVKYQPQFPKEVTFVDAHNIAEELILGYSEERYDEIYLFFTKFESVMRVIPTKVRLLPFNSAEELGVKGEETKTIAEYIYEPSKEKIWETLLPRYIETQIYQAILESMTSEHGARMVSMKAATENADELITDLTLSYNKARQSAITKSLLEISSATEALKDSKR